MTNYDESLWWSMMIYIYLRAAAPAADPGKECEEAEGGPRPRFCFLDTAQFTSEMMMMTWFFQCKLWRSHQHLKPKIDSFVEKDAILWKKPWFIWRCIHPASWVSCKAALVASYSWWRTSWSTRTMRQMDPFMARNGTCLIMFIQDQDSCRFSFFFCWLQSSAEVAHWMWIGCWRTAALAVGPPGIPRCQRPLVTLVVMGRSRNPFFLGRGNFAAWGTAICSTRLEIFRRCRQATCKPISEWCIPKRCCARAGRML